MTAAREPVPKRARLRAGVVGAVAVAVLFAESTTALAQGCTAAPRSPDRLTLGVDEAIAASGQQRFEPAVFTLSWRAPQPVAGAAPEAYLIEAGSAPRLNDVAAVRVPASETTYVVPVANGRYFVRVRALNACGQSALSNEVRAQVRNSAPPGRPNPLVLIASVHATRERVGASAFVRVMGQVRNGWNAGPAVLVGVTASYENRGTGIGVTQQTFASGTSRRLRRTGLPTDTAIEPGASGCFILLARFEGAAITGLGLVASANSVESTPMGGHLEVPSTPAVKPDAFGSVEATTTVLNTGDRPALRPETWLEARDEAGRVLDCVSSPVSASGLLGPGARSETLIATEAEFARARLVRSWVTWEEEQDGEAGAGSPEYRERRASLARLLGQGADASPQQVAAARDQLRAELLRLELDPAGR